MKFFNALRPRLIAITTLIVVVACGVLAFASITAQQRETEVALDREMRSEYQSVSAAFSYEGKTFLAMATLMAANPNVGAAFAERDRDRLLAELTDGMNAIRSSFGYDVMNFFVPPAINMLRVPNPKVFNDDVSERRKMIVELIQDGKPRSGIEPSLTTLAIFGTVPVIHNGQRIGLFEVGMNAGKPFVDSIKERFGVDIAIHLYDGKSFSTIVSTLRDKTTATATEYASAFGGTPVIRRATVDGKAVAAYFGQIRNFSDQPIAVVEIVKNIDEFEAIAAHTRTFLIGATLFIVVIAVIIAFFFGTGMTRPIVQMTRTMSALSAGDIAVEVSGAHRHDEIGQMAAAVQVFKDKMKEGERLRAEQDELRARAEAEKRQALQSMADRFESSVKAVVQGVLTAATEMQSTARSMSTTAETTRAKSAAVAAASEEASVNVQTVSAATEELSSSVSEISRQVSELARIAGEAVEQATATNTQVQALTEAAQKIGEVVQLINDIASQTNLLALNATIEAARAGEAGKGFAVVAAEVKSLATQTAKATGDIADQVKGIQGATGDSMHAIKSIGRTISRINEIATAIASAVEEQNAATQDIARNVQQASKGTAEVNDNIADVTEAAAGAGKASEAVLSAASHLSKEAQTLRAEVDTFLATIRAA